MTDAVLAGILQRIETHDMDYPIRYQLVLDAIARAHRIGFHSGFRLDPQEPAWPVAYIQLPTGQVSWHLPQHPTSWDGHDTPEKYQRIHAYLEA